MVDFSQAFTLIPNNKHFMTEVDLFIVGDRHVTPMSIREDDTNT